MSEKQVKNLKYCGGFSMILRGLTCASVHLCCSWGLHLATGRGKQHLNIRQEKEVHNGNCGATWEQPDLKDGGNKQPIPLQVLLVVENVTVSQVHHQCFFCVLRDRNHWFYNMINRSLLICCFHCAKLESANYYSLILCAAKTVFILFIHFICLA